MSTEDFAISREALLGGLLTRQASTLLFAIENRTAVARAVPQITQNYGWQ